jgi:hypothetical protein
MLIIWYWMGVGQNATAPRRPIRWNYRIHTNSRLNANNIQIQEIGGQYRAGLGTKMNGFDKEGGKATKCGACPNFPDLVFFARLFHSLVNELRRMTDLHLA